MFQEPLLGDEVRIEHRHQLAMTLAQPGVEVARLGVLAFGTMQVATAQPFGQPLHLLTARVIQHQNTGVGIALLRAAQKRALQHRQRLAVGGYKNVHMGPPRRGLPLPMPFLNVPTSIREAAPGQQ